MTADEIEAGIIDDPDAHPTDDAFWDHESVRVVRPAESSRKT